MGIDSKTTAMITSDHWQEIVSTLVVSPSAANPDLTDPHATFSQVVYETATNHKHARDLCVALMDQQPATTEVIL